MVTHTSTVVHPGTLHGDQCMVDMVTERSGVILVMIGAIVVPLHPAVITITMEEVAGAEEEEDLLVALETDPSSPTEIGTPPMMNISKLLRVLIAKC